MPALTNQVREDLIGIIQEELGMVNAQATSVAQRHWAHAEREVSKALGHGDTVIQIEHVKNQIEGLQNELARLEGMVTERARPATLDNYLDAGLQVTPDRFGHVYIKPRVFGREISTAWDALVLKHLNAQLPFFQIYQNLSQLHHVVRRELLLCGNFEEARALYQKFHEKIVQALGDKMPGLLAEVNAIPALQSGEQNDL